MLPQKVFIILSNKLTKFSAFAKSTGLDFISRYFFDMRCIFDIKRLSWEILSSGCVVGIVAGEIKVLVLFYIIFYFIFNVSC